jgi:hypothetical protein
MKVTIELEFENEIITSADVINYLNELIDSNCLDFQIHKTEKKNEL